MALRSKMLSKDPELEEPAQQLFSQRGTPDPNPRCSGSRLDRDAWLAQ